MLDGLGLVLGLACGVVGLLFVALLSRWRDEPESLILAQSERWRHA